MHNFGPAAANKLGGDGYITNVHITDEKLEGTLPQAMCGFRWLKEFDLDGGSMTGTIPQWLATCFPELNELDLSYNQASHIAYDTIWYCCCRYRSDLRTDL